MRSTNSCAARACECRVDLESRFLLSPYQMTTSSEHVRAAAKQKRLRIRRTFPLFGLLLYYGGLVGAASVLIAFVPGFREALVAPFAEPPRSQVDELLTGGHPVVTGPPLPWPGLGGRGMLALTAMSWALAVALPVAW